MAGRARRTGAGAGSAAAAAAALDDLGEGPVLHGASGDPFVDLAAEGGQAWFQRCSCGVVLELDVPAPGANHTVVGQAELAVMAVDVAVVVLAAHVALVDGELSATQPRELVDLVKH